MRTATIDASFEAFHAAHPDIYAQFVGIADDLRRKGVEHYSADAICHVIRWFRITSGKDPSGFKINNNYTALYARKAMDEHPHLDGMFQTRERRTR